MPEAITLRDEAKRPLRILMTEGSSTSAREALYALGPRHTIDILDPSPLCQCRFSIFVRRWHRCPPFASDPCGFLTVLGRLLRTKQYDVLFPPHDEVYLLARMRDALSDRVALAIPNFEAVRLLQSKTRFISLLDELRLPYPPTAVLMQPVELGRWSTFPQYVKLDVGTAGQNVRLIHNPGELQLALREFEERGMWSAGEPVLLQSPAAGRQCVARAVFTRGKLVGVHMNALLVRGIGGAAMARETCFHPVVVEHMRLLGQHLEWHGALFADYFYDECTQTPAYIEANPRIGDTANATLSGDNLCQLWIDVATGEADGWGLTGRRPNHGVRTHSAMLMLMSRALDHVSRRDLLREMWQQWHRLGTYEGSDEEITRIRDDWLSCIPFAWVASRLLIRPTTAQTLVRQTVERYALSSTAAEKIAQIPLGELIACLDGDSAIER